MDNDENKSNKNKVTNSNNSKKNDEPQKKGWLDLLYIKIPY